jgi:hypothetical protein
MHWLGTGEQDEEDDQAREMWKRAGKMERERGVDVVNIRVSWSSTRHTFSITGHPAAIAPTKGERLRFQG